MDMHSRLREARAAAGLESAADACTRFGWKRSTYTQHENGTRGYPAAKAAIYARAFRVSPEWLLYGKGGPERRGVPLVGYVGAGAEIHAFDDGGALDEVDPPPGVGPSAVAVRVRGDSQYPRYSDGDVIVYEDQLPVQSFKNRECIVRLVDGRTLLKTVRAQPNGRWTLESHNAPPIHDAEIEWAATIQWVKRA